MGRAPKGSGQGHPTGTSTPQPGHKNSLLPLAATTSFLYRAADLVERAPTVLSCAACAVLAAPPSADQRHHAQLRCCPAYRRASSLEPTRRRRARAEPRARRSFIVPPTLSCTRRPCCHARRAPFWPYRRAPTDVITLSFVAALPTTVPAHSSRHDNGERAPIREHVVPLSRRRPRRARADRVVVRGVRRSGRTAERRPKSSRSASLLLCLSPRRLPRADTTTASARRSASTSFLYRDADLAERRPTVLSCAACAVLALKPSADRRHHAQLRCCSACRRAGSHEPTRRRRARAEPRARRSFIAPPTSSSARRPCRRARRAPSRPHRRALTDVITLSFVAALPIAAPAHSSRHKNDERAPSRD